MMGLNLFSHHQDLIKLIGAGNLTEQDKTAQHRQTTHSGNGQSHTRTTLRRFVIAPVTYQQEG